MSSNSEIEEMYETLNTPGWDKLCERFADQFEGCNQALGCGNEKDLFIRQGQLIILQQLLTLKDDVKDEMNHAALGDDFDETDIQLSM